VPYKKYYALFCLAHLATRLLSASMVRKAFADGETIRRLASSGSTSNFRKSVRSSVAKHLCIVAGDAIRESSTIV
jgi:hypothetical protein